MRSMKSIFSTTLAHYNVGVLNCWNLAVSHCTAPNNGPFIYFRSGTITRRYHSGYSYNVRDLSCTGKEDDLSQCLSGRWGGYSRCPSSYVVDLDCSKILYMYIYIKTCTIKSFDQLYGSKRASFCQTGQ
jgi:hypothetical protein